MIVDVMLRMKACTNCRNFDIKLILCRIEMCIFVFNHVTSPNLCDVTVIVVGFSLSGSPLKALGESRPRKRERFKLGLLREKPHALA